MLKRLDELLEEEADFAFETTLASKTFAHFIDEAKIKNYEVTLIFFWLNSVELAIERVRTRVKEGGHNIPEDVIVRRCKRGLINFFRIYKDRVNNWMFVDNSGKPYAEIAKSASGEMSINNQIKWNLISKNYEK